MQHPSWALLLALVVANSATVNVAFGQLPLPLGEDTLVRPSQQFDASKFDSLTAVTLRSIFDSAAARGLPTRPLLNLALQGAARRIVGSRIIALVRSHAAAMEDVQTIFGPRSSTSELDACATAMRAGVDGGALSQLRLARPGSSIINPCVVVTDLIQRGIPFATATSSVITLARLPRSDDLLDTLRDLVAKNAARGGSAMAVEALQRYLREVVPTNARAPDGISPRPPDR